MPDTPHYAIDLISLQGCRIRLTFHYQELQRETDPLAEPLLWRIVHANIAQYLAEVAIELAHLEAQSASAA
jgi:hypothetical protein